MKIAGYLICFSLILSACNLFSDTEKESPIARVGNTFLYPKNLEGLLPQDVSPEDSIRLVNSYIQSWVSQQVIIKTAEINLPDALKNFDQQLRDYRNSLLIYTYEDLLVSQKLDTIVSRTEAEFYFEQNVENFRLNQNALKFWFIKIPQDAPFKQRAEELSSLKTLEAKSELIEYCRKYAIEFFIDDDTWFYEREMIRRLPILTEEDRLEKLKEKRVIKIVEEDFILMIGIFELKNKGEHAPLSLVREVVESAILNKRKLDFLKEMRTDLQKAAQRNNEIEFF
ncbi:MAG: hypothetical protein ACXITV_02500 [Luteibaculaceae bacterium]